MLKHLPTLLIAACASVGLFVCAANAAEQVTLQGSFATGLGTWVLQTLEHTAATASETTDGGKPVVHITVPTAGEKRYYVQLVGKGIPLRAGKTYHLRFRARSKPACEIAVVAGSYHEKFEELWRQDHINVKDGWADHTCDITPKADDESAQIIFGGLAAQAAEYWFAGVTLTE